MVFGGIVAGVRKGHEVGTIKKSHVWVAIFSDCAHKISVSSAVFFTLRDVRAKRTKYFQE